MITTVNTKQQQLEKGFFSIGTGKENILVMGSCRAVPYVTYLYEWNVANGNRFTIHFIDPFNWHFDLNNNRVDLEAVVTGLETDERILTMLASVDIFIHEYYKNFGMFNCERDAPKNIYQFGMKAKVNICIPNFNDLFILVGDILAFDMEVRKMAIQDYNTIKELSNTTFAKIKDISNANIDKFIEVCYLSDLPEMVVYFTLHFTTIRLFWTSNHVSKWFTLEVFKLMNQKFLFLDLSAGFNESHVDLYANNYTPITKYDILMHHYHLYEETVPVEKLLFAGN